MKSLVRWPLAVQLSVTAAALSVLAVQPLAAGPALLVPFDGRTPGEAIGPGVRVLGTGPLPGSIVVTRPPQGLTGTGYLVLAAPATDCGSQTS